jgi:pSer/pThr/pTyr-binding forkhead associated (FHA) protein
MSDIRTTSYDPSAAYMMTRVARPEPQPRFVGLLRPEVGALPPQAIPILCDQEELLIGRQSGLGLSLADDAVSRTHARVRRVGHEFVLEDLNSSNGTYVDGVPIVSCVLRPGDWIQIGCNLFRFEVQLSGSADAEGLKTWLG